MGFGVGVAVAVGVGVAVAVGLLPHPNPYVPPHINNRYINSYKSPPAPLSLCDKVYCIHVYIV